MLHFGTLERNQQFGTKVDVWSPTITIARAQILLATEVTTQLATYTTELNNVRSFCIDTVFTFCSVSQRSPELCTFVFV